MVLHQPKPHIALLLRRDTVAPTYVFIRFLACSVLHSVSAVLLSSTNSFSPGHLLFFCSVYSLLLPQHMLPRQRITVPILPVPTM